MELPTIPENLEAWKPEVLNELLKYPDIESETFDFKEDSTKLYEDICAMANTKGGFLVLGIGEVRDNDGQRIIKFKKVGFRKGIEESVRNEIGNYMVMIEPIPIVHIDHIRDNESDKFFTIVKIEGKTSEKPYFVKTTDQCYARIQSSSRRVGRTVILNLFSDGINQRKNLEKLHSSALVLSDEFLKTIDFSKSVHPSNATRIPLIELGFMRDAILSNESFLREKGLMNNSSESIIEMIHILAKFNIIVKGYNNSDNEDEKRKLQHEFYNPSYTLHAELKRIKPILDNIIKICNSELEKYH